MTDNLELLTGCESLPCRATYRPLPDLLKSSRFDILLPEGEIKYMSCVSTYTTENSEAPPLPNPLRQ